MTVTVTKDGTADLMKAIRSLTTKQVLVGVPDSTAGREPEEGESTALSNAEIGYLMETGMPEKNVPARPHLVPGVESVIGPITDRMKAGAKAAIEGNKSALDTTFDTVGLIAQNAVRKKITDGPFIPLSPVTLAKRKARGRTGEKPLIDTGQLRQAQTYVIRKT